MSVLPTFTSLYHMRAWFPQKPEEDDLLGLELEKVVSHHVGAGNQNPVLPKSSQCPSLLSQLHSKACGDMPPGIWVIRKNKFVVMGDVL